MLAKFIINHDPAHRNHHPGQSLTHRETLCSVTRKTIAPSLFPWYVAGRSELIQMHMPAQVRTRSASYHSGAEYSLDRVTLLGLQKNTKYLYRTLKLYTPFGVAMFRAQVLFDDAFARVCTRASRLKAESGIPMGWVL